MAGVLEDHVKNPSGLQLRHNPLRPVDAQLPGIQLGLVPASAPAPARPAVVVVVDAVVIERIQVFLAGARIQVSGRLRAAAVVAASSRALLVLVVVPPVALSLRCHQFQHARAAPDQFDHVLVGRLRDVDVVDGQDVVS